MSDDYLSSISDQLLETLNEIENETNEIQASVAQGKENYQTWKDLDKRFLNTNTTNTTTTTESLLYFKPHYSELRKYASADIEKGGLGLNPTQVENFLAQLELNNQLCQNLYKDGVTGGHDNVLAYKCIKQCTFLIDKLNPLVQNEDTTDEFYILVQIYMDRIKQCQQQLIESF